MSKLAHATACACSECAALALVNKARSHGVSLNPGGDKIYVGGPKAERDKLIPALRALKPSVLALLRRTDKPSASGEGVPCSACGRYFAYSVTLSAYRRNGQVNQAQSRTLCRRCSDGN